jgi:predicted AAA+ superfamily ATPase
MQNKVIERKIYTDEIKGFIDVEQLKVITGMRRSGKSQILKLFIDDLEKKADVNHIIYINFESSEFDSIITYKELNAYIESKMTDEKRYYIFLDEIQDVENWEKSVNSLRLRNTDIYITGSNSKLLAGELSTLLSGRYLEFKIYPLSFKEFMEFRNTFGISTNDIDKELDAYINMGGFPLVSTGSFTFDQAKHIVADIHASAVLKDVVKRHKIKNTDLLEKIIAFIYDNLGNPTSLRKIAEYLKSQKRSGADLDTISNYLSYLQEACIIYKSPRYDVNGKRLLESNEKYYIADHMLQYAVRDKRSDKVQGVLENIVYLELLRRGYRVSIGRLNAVKNTEKEIDFVAEKESKSEKIYLQVCMEYSSSQKTREREFAPLKEIRDNYPKYVVTLDKFWECNDEGIKGIHLKDFLLLEKF